MRRFSRNKATVPRDSVDAPLFARASRQTLWFTRLKALLKSMDTKDSAEQGSSSPLIMKSHMSARKWFVLHPFIPQNWFGRMTTSLMSLSSTTDSRILDSMFVHDRFLSWSIDSTPSFLGMADFVSNLQASGQRHRARQWFIICVAYMAVRSAHAFRLVGRTWPVTADLGFLLAFIFSATSCGENMRKGAL